MQCLLVFHRLSSLDFALLRLKCQRSPKEKTLIQKYQLIFAVKGELQLLQVHSLLCYH